MPTPTKAKGGEGKARVLIGCEESGTVRDAFRALGYDAWSCDLLPSRGDPRWHHQGDLLALLRATRGQWDRIIMHPPCDALCLAGNGTYGTGKSKAHEREIAIAWTWSLWDEAVAHCPCVAMENPKSVLTRRMKRTQVIQPWQFGHMEQKETWLWLHGLPLLVATNNVYAEMMRLPKSERERVFYMSPGPMRKRDRSKTFQGIADAMAAQWGQFQSSSVTERPILNREAAKKEGKPAWREQEGARLPVFETMELPLVQIPPLDRLQLTPNPSRP
jgi:hypothetical protein